ncbi:MAG: helix-turn-helix domain-containing protein [Pirellulales bacterium]|nr:helix-turn-helix domain-containing protein [Pirellulales bacterium]
MLAPHLQEEIRRLLAAGKMSRRKIARLTGVSRGTVGLIAAGKRRGPVPPWEDDPARPLEPPKRCPSCGGLVFMPCRLCRMRQVIEKRKQSENTHASPSGGQTFLSGLRKTGKNACPPDLLKNWVRPQEILGLALKPDHRRRYEEVRRRRKELGIVEESLVLENPL